MDSVICQAQKKLKEIGNLSSSGGYKDFEIWLAQVSRISYFVKLKDLVICLAQAKLEGFGILSRSRIWYTV